jgi:hypothetical protein
MQLERVRGDTAADVITIKSGNTPVDLTGCSALMTINSLRNPPDDSTQIYQVAGVITTFDSSISFSPTEEQADLVGFYYYDIQLTDATGHKRTLVKDAYVFTQDITKN